MSEVRLHRRAEPLDPEMLERYRRIPVANVSNAGRWDRSWVDELLKIVEVEE